MTTLKHMSDGLSAWRFSLGVALAVLCLLSVGMFWPSAASAAPATTTSATESCQPTDGNPTGECEPRTDDGAVEWNAYDETPQCVGYVAVGTASGAISGPKGAVAGFVGGVGTCWVNSW